MKKTLNRVKVYLSQPATGAGLLYVAVAFGVMRLWVLHLHAAITRGAGFTEELLRMLSGSGPREMFFLWTIVSFALSAWLAFLLLRRRIGRRLVQRLLLVAVVHAAGAIRFYDWGMLLLSILPLFAIAPLLLVPVSSRTR